MSRHRTALLLAAGVIIWELTQDDDRGEPVLLQRVGERFRENRKKS